MDKGRGRVRTRVEDKESTGKGDQERGNQQGRTRRNGDQERRTKRSGDQENTQPKQQGYKGMKRWGREAHELQKLRVEGRMR